MIDDHLYSAILRSLEQTRCARLWFYTSDKLFIARFLNIHRSGVIKRWHGWCHMKLQPSRRMFCVHHTTMQSHIRKVYASLAVTCHLHFWQNDRDLLRATAVTRGVEQIPKLESAQIVDPGEENSPAAPTGI